MDKKINRVTISLFVSAYMFVAAAYADNHTDVPAYGGVDALACDYLEGKGLDDLLRVSEKWNGWASKNFSKVYTGNVVTPYFYDESASDVYWVGFSPSLSDQGTVLGEWQAKGGKMQEEFDAVVACKSRSQFAWRQVRDEQGPLATGVIDFSACKITPEATQEKMAVADTQMNEFLSDVDSSVRIYRWFPLQGIGEKNRDIDYFQANWHESLEAKGANLDKFAMNGGPQLRSDVYGPLTECSGLHSSTFVFVGGSASLEDS